MIHDSILHPATVILQGGASAIGINFISLLSLINLTSSILYTLTSLIKYNLQTLLIKIRGMSKTIILKMIVCFECSGMHIIDSRGRQFQFTKYLKSPRPSFHPNLRGSSLFSETFLKVSQSMHSTASLIQVFSPISALGASCYTISFKYCRKKQSRGIKSGEHGGHKMGPAHCNQQLGYIWSKYRRTKTVKSGKAPSWGNMMFSVHFRSFGNAKYPRRLL